MIAEQAARMDTGAGVLIPLSIPGAEAQIDPEAQGAVPEGVPTGPAGHVEATVNADRPSTSLGMLVLSVVEGRTIRRE